MNEERLARKKVYDKQWAIDQRLKDPIAWRAKVAAKQKERRKKYGDRVRELDRARYAVHREQVRAKTKEWYAKNVNGMREKAIANYRKNYFSGKIKHRLRSAWHAAKLRAKKRGLEFDLKLADLGEPTHCAASGVEFDLTASFRSGNIFVPSLDRIDPKLGYVRGNVRVVCHGYNLAKHTGTDANVVILARAIVAMADKPPPGPD